MFQTSRAPESIARTGEAIKRSLSGRSLCSVRLFQSVVGRKSLLPPFHSPLVSIASASPEKGAGRYYASSPSSSHALFLRSAGLLHPQYRFIPLRSAGYAPLHSSRIMSVAPGFLAVAPSHSHRGWHR